MFNEVGAFLRNVFTYARSIGVQTCVGNEAPLLHPFNDTAHSSLDFYGSLFNLSFL